MFELDIPGFGSVRLEHLVSDFTGTLSVDGKLFPGVDALDLLLNPKRLKATLRF